MTRIESIVVFSLLCIFSYAHAWEKKDIVTYFGTTAETVAIAWDPVDMAGSYEVELFNVERGVTITLDDPKTSKLQKTIQLPYSGHFIPRVRAWAGSECSAWSESTNPAVSFVDGQPRAWWLYGHVAPAGPISIGGR